MKIYISGKITGLEKSEYERNFQEAEDNLKLLSAVTSVLNPLKATSHLNPSLHTWEQYMLVCIEELFKCDGVYALKNWYDSKGSIIEISIAKTLGKRIIYEENKDITF